MSIDVFSYAYPQTKTMYDQIRYFFLCQKAETKKKVTWKANILTFQGTIFNLAYKL